VSAPGWGPAGASEPRKGGAVSQAMRSLIELDYHDRSSHQIASRHCSCLHCADVAQYIFNLLRQPAD